MASSSNVKTSQLQNRPQHIPNQSLAVIELQGVQVRYAKDGPLVLDIDSLTIHQGERIALIGPSGAAKTTLLRLINGYVLPQAGQVSVLGRNSNRAEAGRRRVGFVFQDFNLVDRATVFQNVLWGRLGRVNTLLSLFGQFSERDKQLAMQAVAEVDLVEQAGQRADTLSGGQKQRVAVARVLAQEAEIILADEPVSNLDPALADDILQLLVDISHRHGVTLLMSVHQPSLAQRHAERIIGLNQGRIVFDGNRDTLNKSTLQTIYGRNINFDMATTSDQNSYDIDLSRQPNPAELESGR